MNGSTRWVMITAAAGTCALAVGGWQAYAQVVAVSRCSAGTQGCDPTPLVSIGTAGEATKGSVFAASVGGNAQSEPQCWLPQDACSPGSPGDAAVSTTGSAGGGQIAASGGGSADGNVAGVSGTGCAAGDVAVNAVRCSGDSGNVSQNQGPGSANGGTLAASGTGSSSAQIVAVSGLGHSWACDGPVTVSVSAQDFVNGLTQPNSQPNSCAGTVSKPVTVQEPGISVQ
jgi:hypothetical protein